MKGIFIFLITTITRGLDLLATVIGKSASALRLGLYLGFLHDRRADDIWIASYPKSGTTVTQMLVYQLCSGADTQFRHIEDVSPWFEIFAAINPEQLGSLASPRVLKTHMKPRFIPRNGRVIYVYRDPKDVAISFYNQLAGIYNYEGDLDAFVNRFLAGKVPYGSWFRHLSMWASRSETQAVLFLNYDDLCNDLESCARKIVAFCDLNISEELLQTSVENASFQQMKAMNYKFDPRLAQRKRRLGSNGSRDFIRSGKAGSGAANLSPPVQEQINKKVQDTLKEIEQAVPNGNPGLTF
jgi:hypothetical protein